MPSSVLKRTRHDGVGLLLVGLAVAWLLTPLPAPFDLVTAIILGMAAVFWLQPGGERRPALDDAEHRTRQARWDAGWLPS